MHLLLQCTRRNAKISSNQDTYVLMFFVASYISRIEIQPRPTLSKDYKHNVFCPISRGNTVVLEEAMERVFNGKESKPHRNPSDLLWLICAAMIRGWSVGRVRAAPALSWAPGACRWLRPTTRDFRTGNSSTECTNQRIGSRLHIRVVLLWSIIHQCTEDLVVE